MNAVWPHAPATATPTSAAYLMGRFRSQTGDLPQQLGIVAPVSELRLDVAPAQDALLVDQEIRTIGEGAVLEQYVLPSPKRGQGDVGPRGGRQREIGRHGPDGQYRRGRSRQRQPTCGLSTARAIQ